MYKEVILKTRKQMFLLIICLELQNDVLFKCFIHLTERLKEKTKCGKLIFSIPRERMYMVSLQMQLRSKKGMT
jgi:hypothetical protein